MAARTDLGCARKNNEDAYQVERAHNLYVLSDGLGGQANGEVASAMAVETVVAYCVAAEKNRAAPLATGPLPDFSDRTKHLLSAVTIANRKIFDFTKSDPLLQGMGATIVAAWIDGRQMSLVHVGDSRAYLLRGDTFRQLTADHSLVAEQVRRGILTPQQAETSELQSVLLRALGTAEQVEADADEHSLLDGDTVLLCSDGLTRMVADAEIAGVLMTDEPVQSTADRLVDLANNHGGADNISVIVVRLRASS